jgi:hypothetical protein
MMHYSDIEAAELTRRWHELVLSATTRYLDVCYSNVSYGAINLRFYNAEHVIRSLNTLQREYFLHGRSEQAHRRCTGWQTVLLQHQR